MLLNPHTNNTGLNSCSREQKWKEEGEEEEKAGCQQLRIEISDACFEHFLTSFVYSF
jgi:hypothetical protein